MLPLRPPSPPAPTITTLKLQSKPIDRISSPSTSGGIQIKSFASQQACQPDGNIVKSYYFSCSSIRPSSGNLGSWFPPAPELPARSEVIVSIREGTGCSSPWWSSTSPSVFSGVCLDRNEPLFLQHFLLIQPLHLQHIICSYMTHIAQNQNVTCSSLDDRFLRHHNLPCEIRRMGIIFSATQILGVGLFVIKRSNYDRTTTLRTGFGNYISYASTADPFCGRPRPIIDTKNNRQSGINNPVVIRILIDDITSQDIRQIPHGIVKPERSNTNTSAERYLAEKFRT